MKWSLRARLGSGLVVGLLALGTPLSPLLAQDKGAVNVTVTAAAAPPPPVSITLYERHGHVTPMKRKCTHTGGGLIDISSPSSDTVIITMSGAVISNAEMKFDLEQSFEITFDDPKVKAAKLTVEARVIGLLRGEPAGCAEYSEACAHVNGGPVPLVSLCVPPHSVCQYDSLAVNDHDGPHTVPVLPGKYTLQQTFAIAAHSRCLLCKRPSAEFAPDPALDPLWINYFEPFHGVKKDSFGFQVTLKVAADNEGANGNGKKAEVLPMPEKKGQ
jgi:hypothetical protein